MRLIALLGAALTLAALVAVGGAATAQTPTPSPTPRLCPAPLLPGQPPSPTPTPIPCPPTPTPTPTPPPPVVVDIPGEAVMPPNGTVIFRRADGATLSVSGLGGATVAYDGTNLTVTVPAIGPKQGLSGGGEGAVCLVAPLGQRVLSCSARPTLEGARVALGISIVDPPRCPAPVRPGEPPASIPCPTPTPTPAPRAISIPGETTVASGETVVFVRADGASLTVSYGGGPEPARATYDGETLTVTVPPLNAFQSLYSDAGCETPNFAASYARRHIVRCSIQPTREGARVAVTVIHGDPPIPLRLPAPPGFSIVELARGCNNIALTFPDGANVGAVAGSIVPNAFPDESTRVIEAIWKYDSARQRFLGWSPLSDAPNDFQRVNRLDTVSICMGVPGRLMQPAIP